MAGKNPLSSSNNRKVQNMVDVTTRNASSKNMLWIQPNLQQRPEAHTKMIAGEYGWVPKQN